MDFMVAVGTHPPLSEEKILGLYGITAQSRKEKFGRSEFFCHRWDLPETFLQIGHLSEEEVERISGGLLKEKVSIEINRKIYDYDLILILGPFFRMKWSDSPEARNTCSRAFQAASYCIFSTGWPR